MIQKPTRKNLEILTIMAALTMNSATAGPRPRIVLTHFDPFGGAALNASAQVATKAAEILSRDFEVRVCELPTAYDRASKMARACVQEFAAGARVDLVLSIGEAGCRIRLETMAHNRDDMPGLPDNAGVIRSRSAIAQQGPDSVPMPFPVEATLARADLTEEERKFVDLSQDPGGFVCNNTAYRLARHFSTKVATAYTFVHVPNHRCEELEKKSAISASVISKLVKAHLGGTASR